LLLIQARRLTTQVFAPIAFVSSLIGVTGLGWLVRKSGRASIIVLLMVRLLLQSFAASAPSCIAYA
jgi:hypothetical protein